MPLRDLLGRFVTLTIERVIPPGAVLVDAGDRARGEPDDILLPRSEVPDGVKVGDAIEVFVYLDSEDRPTATLRTPRLALGEVAFLEVTALTKVGAFFDWGLTKELLVPFSRQTRDVEVGERHPIGLYVDSSERLAGTMRVSELLRDIGEFKLDEWVEGEAWRKTNGLGVFVIVERAFVGLLPESEPCGLGRGDAARFRVSNILPDGKIELSQRGHAHEEIDKDAQHLLDVLTRPGAPRISDRSPPEQVRALFGLSKKSFKRAVSRLLRDQKITLGLDGTIQLPKPPEAASPPARPPQG
jgi:uncharacterized protein